MLGFLWRPVRLRLVKGGDVLGLNCAKQLAPAAFVLASTAGAIIAGASMHVALAAAKARQAVRATLEDDSKAVRIVFRDGQSLVVPMQDSQAARFDAPTISEDGRTVSWMEELQLAASYADAAQVYVYRDGKAVEFLTSDRKPTGMDGCSRGGVVRDWHIFAPGRQLYIACGFPHGLPSEYRNLYDIDTGKLIVTVAVDNDTGNPPRDAPAWVKSSK